MNFLDLIWLIPLFPLFGAAVMLLVGKKLDPQHAVAVGTAMPRHGAGQGADQPFSARHGAAVVPASRRRGDAAGRAAGESVHQVIQYTWVAGLPFPPGERRPGDASAPTGASCSTRSAP